MPAPVTDHPPSQHYVAGFLMDGDDNVVLVVKNRPAWQAGRLNGVGGKVEAGESPHAAMVREFSEEAGLVIEEWEAFLTLSFGHGAVHFFRAFAPAAVLAAAASRTDEQIVVLPVTGLLGPGAPTIANLRWILPLAAHRHDAYAPVVVRELPASGPAS